MLLEYSVNESKTMDVPTPCYSLVGGNIYSMITKSRSIIRVVVVRGKSTVSIQHSAFCATADYLEIAQGYRVNPQDFWAAYDVAMKQFKDIIEPAIEGRG